MNINNEYVSFETAKLAKLKGFNIPCVTAFDKKGHLKVF